MSERNDLADRQPVETPMTKEALEAENAELSKDAITDWWVNHQHQFGHSDFIDRLCDMALRTSAAEAESARLREALAELVRLRDLSDTLPADPTAWTDTHLNTFDYLNNRTIKTWEAARAALAPSGEQR